MRRVLRDDSKMRVCAKRSDSDRARCGEKPTHGRKNIPREIQRGECLESHLLKKKNSGMVGRFAPIATMSPFQVLRRHTDDSQN